MPSSPPPPPPLLPPSFLTAPPSHPPTTTRIDFPSAGLPAYNSRYAILIDNALSASECALLVHAASAHTNAHGWEKALVNIGNGRQKLLEDTRNCGRIIWDDALVVGRIWERIRGFVPEVEVLRGWEEVLGRGPVRRGEAWRAVGLNERMRVLRYGRGEYFRPHMDGCYVTPDGEERSYLTLHLYLNDSESEVDGEKLEGGATTFHSHDMQRAFDVVPKVGRVLLFQQRELLHSGADVTAGVKLTMRTDLMYRKIEKEDQKE